ncbi:hypothetical protein [Pseudaestuariivita atlantica]|uniref:hypothetical protein n=1 Tax=Pseudaestuariivita atlantica TaxID=1317121 RepID=UPI0013F3ADBC|nr:hypothetical protein [Pseudaestuariivita atlantica]
MASKTQSAEERASSQRQIYVKLRIAEIEAELKALKAERSAFIKERTKESA